MLDYSFYLKDTFKYFILNYKVVGDKILIICAKNEERIIPYSIENEQKILNQMEVQVQLAKKLLTKLKTNKTLLLGTNCIANGGVMFYIMLSAFNYIDPPFESALLCLFNSIMTGYLIPKDSELIADLRKNTLFVQNEELINWGLSEGIISCDGYEQLNINDVDKMSYDGIRKLVKDVKHSKKHRN